MLNAGLAQPVSAPPAPVPPPKAAPMKAKVQEPDDVDKDLLKECGTQLLCFAFLVLNLVFFGRLHAHTPQAEVEDTKRKP